MSERIDIYPDRLFDVLAGGGAEGRQVLAKAESELREAAEAGVAAGLNRDEAARRAIAHFGTPQEVARARFAYGIGSVISSLGRLFAAAWLFFGVAMSAIGLAGVLSLAALVAFALFFPCAWRRLSFGQS